MRAASWAANAGAELVLDANMSEIKVMLVVDHPIVRISIQRMLESDPAIVVVACAAPRTG